MDKIWLVIKREYLTRVRKRSFIIMTLIGPLFFASLILLPAWLATQTTDEKVIQVIDESGFFKDRFENSTELLFEYKGVSSAQAKIELLESDDYAMLYIPEFDINDPKGIVLYTKTNPSITVQASLERKLRMVLEEVKLDQSGIDKATLENLKVDLDLKTFNLSGEGEETKSDATSASALAYFSSFMIYFFILFYGTQILRGVAEEKTNRIIEVIISSLKPFQLMMGKIIGIAGVGLTQFLMWVFLTGTIVGILFLVFGLTPPPEPELATAPEQPDMQWMTVANTLAEQNWLKIIGLFVFYFLGGYLLYGALFAAAGSAIDHDSDAQQFVFPITLPLIFSIAMLVVVLNEPNGPLAVVLSIFPLTAPVVMMMRVPFGAPDWQILLSVLFLIGGFIFTTWVAGRIYRIGILIYGTKVNYKSLVKWFLMDR